MTLEILSEVFARMTPELLIEKTNDPEAEIDSEGDCWVHGTWKPRDFQNECCAWLKERTESGPFYINGPELGVESIGTEADWKEFLAGMGWDSFEENIAGETLLMCD